MLTRKRPTPPVERECTMQSALTSWLLPFATGIIVAVFTLLLYRQWRERRKVHQLWWTIGFAMYSAAAFMEFVAQIAGGWPGWLFKVYVIVSATLVAVLAQGSVALMSRTKTWPRLYLAYNTVCFAALVFGVATTQLIAEELAKAALSSYAPLGGTALTYPRVMSMLLTIPGALILFWSAILSILRFMRKREYAYRVWANVLIATATLVIASGGSLAKADNTTLFYLAEIVAACLYFAGFVMASTLKKGSDAIKEKRHAQDGPPTESQ